MSETPDLSNLARIGRVRELNSRLQKLVTTGAQINTEDPALIDALFTQAEQTGVLAIANRVAARLAVIEAAINEIDISA